MTDKPRETLSIRTPKTAVSRQQIAKQDFEELMLNPKFKRTLFTILHTAGMFSGNYQPGGRDLGFAEGRRSLGLDILRTAEQFAGPDALLRILEAERETLKEAPDARRKPDDDGNERSRELGFVGDDDDGDREVGLQFLTYD